MSGQLIFICLTYIEPSYILMRTDVNSESSEIARVTSSFHVARNPAEIAGFLFPRLVRGNRIN